MAQYNLDQGLGFDSKCSEKQKPKENKIESSNTDTNSGRSWFWWRSNKTTSIQDENKLDQAISVKTSESNMVDLYSHYPNQSEVQPLRAPIYLGIASPPLSQEDHEQEHDSRLYYNYF